MLALLWLIPLLPLAGALALLGGGAHWPRRLVSIVGAGAVGLAALCALAVGGAFVAQVPPALGTVSPEAAAAQGHVYVQELWTWLQAGGVTLRFALYLDALSLVMTAVITVVGFLILLFSTDYMAGEEGYPRFMGYMNLFVGAMLVLVLADSLLLLYLGWEGVGLCSYLLIGFWHRDPANGLAARKAFVVTRLGDTAMLIGLVLLLTETGTLEIQKVMGAARTNWADGSGLATVAAALLLAGAVGKSAQLPLQVWLPDAMAGPTPTSALIHAATMVTAGVYLIARTHALFLCAPAVMLAVAIIGVVTCTLAGLSALAQVDIKRVLAYSTISQVGYMFLALGVGAWAAGVFHFMTHAFFKALLFLCAGLIVKCQHEERDILRMGGLRARQPLLFWTFLIGALSLADLPLVTAGFFSKDAILREVWASPAGGAWPWAFGLLATVVTSLYVFRLFFLVFLGEPRREATGAPGVRAALPCVALAVLAAVGGFVETPHALGNVTLFSDFLHTALPHAPGAPAAASAELALMLAAGGASVLGIALAFVLYRRDAARARRVARLPGAAFAARCWRSGWGFDRLYELVCVRPFLWVTDSLKRDDFDLFVRDIAAFNAACHRLLSRAQAGSIRWYVAGIGIGVVITMGIVLFL